ncbi:MAG: hypothetical protein ACOC0N_04080 [Chroococcales cyanobacterium]
MSILMQNSPFLEVQVLQSTPGMMEAIAFHLRDLPSLFPNESLKAVTLILTLTVLNPVRKFRFSSCKETLHATSLHLR